MGLSTDAHIIYGIDLQEDAPPNMTDDEWDQLLEDNWRDEDWAELGFEIDFHCSAEYPMHIVAMPGTRIYASRGYPEKLALPHLPWPENDDAAHNYSQAVKKLGLDPDDASWLLYSNTG